MDRVSDDDVWREVDTDDEGATKRQCCVTGVSTTPSPLSVCSPLDRAAGGDGDNGGDATMFASATTPGAITARRLMAIHLQRVVVDFCDQKSFFKLSDVEMPKAQTFLFLSQAEDPMGVASAAIAILRAFYSGNTAVRVLDRGKHMGLKLECRQYMAAALFLAYKAKSEDLWAGGYMSRAVMCAFVTRQEFPDDEACEALAPILCASEMELIMSLPIARLLEHDLYGEIEERLIELKKQKVVDDLSSMAVLSCFARYNHAMHTTLSLNTECLDQIRARVGVKTLGSAFTLIGMLSFVAGVEGMPEDLNVAFDDLFGEADRCVALEIVETVRNTILDPGASPSTAVLVSTATRNRVAKMLHAQWDTTRVQRV